MARLTCRVAIAFSLASSACGDTSSPNASDDGADETGGEEAGSGGSEAPTSTTSAADSGGSESGGVAMRPDWVHDVAPLVTEHCNGCHVDGGIAPFALADYATASQWAPSIAQQVEQRIMPPWHAVETDECDPPLPFLHDARLSDAQIQLLIDWNDLGAPQGDPADAAPLPDPPSLDLSDPNTTVAMGGSVEITATATQRDFFHCLSFDPGNDTDVYVDGLQVIPGNRAIVHHVLIFVDTDAESASWPGGVQEDCGGGSGVGGATLIGGWVPGSLPIEMPDGVGVQLPAGARLVFNMHYHSSTAQTQTDDATAIALRWSTTLPQWIGSFQLIGAPGGGDIVDPPFEIPAGATGHQETVRLVVPDLGIPEVRVFSIANHMHKVGVEMRTTLTHDGNETCMVQTPRWDFDWQRLYRYDAPVDELPVVEVGDIVEVRCTYDNTLDNAALVEALGEIGVDQPQDVSLGEGTLDEMCLAGVGFAVRPF